MFDLIIVGGGPGGLTAAIYALRAKKSVLLLEKTGIGGQTALTPLIENFPGFKSIDGFSLSQKMLEQAMSLGLAVKSEEVIEYSLEKDIKSVRTHRENYESKAIIIATGAIVKELNADGERKLIGKGVSYCATCDGNFFRNRDVAVVGGGNTSLQDVLYLFPIAKKIYLIHRRDQFRGNEITAEKIFNLAKDNPDKLKLVLSSEITKINGVNFVESVEVKNKVTQENKTLKVDGVFIAVGRKPDTEMFKGILNLDESGCIITNEHMMTNIKNVFAVGDVRNTPLRQIVTACGDGAIAASSIIND